MDRRLWSVPCVGSHNPAELQSGFGRRRLGVRGGQLAGWGGSATGSSMQAGGAGGEPVGGSAGAANCLEDEADPSDGRSLLVLVRRHIRHVCAGPEVRDIAAPDSCATTGVEAESYRVDAGSGPAEPARGSTTNPRAPRRSARPLSLSPGVKCGATAGVPERLAVDALHRAVVEAHGLPSAMTPDEARTIAVVGPPPRTRHDGAKAVGSCSPSASKGRVAELRWGARSGRQSESYARSGPPLRSPRRPRLTSGNHSVSSGASVSVWRDERVSHLQRARRTSSRSSLPIGSRP